MTKKILAGLGLLAAVGFLVWRGKRGANDPVGLQQDED